MKRHIGHSSDICGGVEKLRLSWAARGWWIILLSLAGNAAAQEFFTSFLLAQKLPQQPSFALTLYGYPGSTNQVEYTDSLSTTGSWSVLTNFVLTTSAFTFVDPGLPQTGQRFYRGRVLGATPLATPSALVWIPPGQFLMGSPVTEQDRNIDEGPQTWVTLTRGFYISRHLVTQGEYLAVMGNNPSYFQGDTNRPVESTGWFNATNYCDALTRQEHYAGRLPQTWRYRLPTEAEWEYACRAGTTTRFSYGDDPSYAQLPVYAWYDANSYTNNQPPGPYYLVIGRYYTSHPVEQKLPNPWGLYDMHGDLSEWCQDWFGLYPGGSMIDPQGPPSGSERVIRSGSWLDDAYALRSAMRYMSEPDNASGIYGFRVVLAPASP